MPPYIPCHLNILEIDYSLNPEYHPILHTTPTTHMYNHIQYPTMDIIAVDISGRHEHEGEYLMVGAAVAADITPSRINRIHGIKATVHKRSAPPQLGDVVDIVIDTVIQLMKLKEIKQLKNGVTT